jgi:hypothetical protein
MVTARCLGLKQILLSAWWPLIFWDYSQESKMLGGHQAFKIATSSVEHLVVAKHSRCKKQS